MTLIAPKKPSTEVRNCRAELALRGITVRELAAKIGFEHQHVANVLSAGATSKHVQTAINRFFKKPIFATVHLSKKTARAIRRAKNNIPTPHV
jgi:hypothetical protein